MAPGRETGGEGGGAAQEDAEAAAGGDVQGPAEDGLGVEDPGGQKNLEGRG